MATDVSPVFVDTNILVFAHLAKSPFHRAAIEQLHQFEDAEVELWISRQTLR